jgi:hypothetical protein
MMQKRMIVFVLGGITRTEISALQAMEKEQSSNEFNYLVGSTEVFSSKQFLDIINDADTFSEPIAVEEIEVIEEEKRRSSVNSIKTDSDFGDY